MCSGVMVDRCSSARGFMWFTPATPFALFVGSGLGLRGGDDPAFVRGVRVSGCVSFKFGAPLWGIDEPKVEIPVLVDFVDPTPEVPAGTLPDSSSPGWEDGAS